MTGWGFTSLHGNPSEELKELEVNLISNEECRKNIGNRYVKYVKKDKLCAGHLNKGKLIFLNPPQLSCYAFRINNTFF